MCREQHIARCEGPPRGCTCRLVGVLCEHLLCVFCISGLNPRLACMAVMALLYNQLSYFSNLSFMIIFFFLNGTVLMWFCTKLVGMITWARFC